MYANLTHHVAAEQTADRHRAAEQSQLVAQTRKPRTTQPRERSFSMTRSWLGLRRRPKVA
jgi:hypothetical protein